MKKFILGIIVGGFIFGTSTFALSNYLYKADEVSYTPSDINWNVDSVDKAIDDLYTRTTTMMPIPTATKTITSNGSNIDVLNYAKVNVNISTNPTYTDVAISNQYSVPVEAGKKYLAIMHNTSWCSVSGYQQDYSFGNVMWITTTASTLSGRWHGDDVNYGCWVISLKKIN